MTIELRIDRIVLDDSARSWPTGLPQSGIPELREAVCAELVRLLTVTPASAWRADNRARITVRSIPMCADPGEFGGTVARSVWSGLLGGDRSRR